jgi:diguanylate cyclase (GGDEF)-like protein
MSDRRSVSAGEMRTGMVTRVRLVFELALAAMLALAFTAWRLGARAQFGPVDARLIALTVFGLIVSVSALIAARWASRDNARFWTLIAAGCVIWDSGRADPSGADRQLLLALNGVFLAGLLLFAATIGWKIHSSSTPAARQKLALDLMPQMIGLAVVIWLFWLGPQTLGSGDPAWLKMIDFTHGVGDFILFSLCLAGIFGRRQGIVGGPTSLLLNGAGLLALGDAVALPGWERDSAGVSAISQAVPWAGFAVIGLATLRAWRARGANQDERRLHRSAPAWMCQFHNLVLVGLLAIAAAQIIFGDVVPAGAVTAVIASVVVIAFGMIRQSLTARRERRLRLEIDELSSRIDGLVSQVGRDPLTGLFDHRAIHERLDHELDNARLSGSTIAVALIDVDNFKLVNDRRGHQTGDRVLRAVSSILSAACRATDVAARYAGDEFMLVLPGVDEARAKAVCERIADEVRQVNEELNLGAGPRVTLSIGVAVSYQRGRGVREMVALADAAMYDAKEAGKDRVVVVNAETFATSGAARAMSPVPLEFPLLQAAPRRPDRRRPSWAERAS